MVCIVNGQLIDKDKATVGITDLALMRGYGIFDFFRLTNGVALFLEDHLERFYKGAQGVGLLIQYDKKELKRLLHQLIEANNMPVSGIRLILTGGYAPNGYDVSQKSNLFITQEPISFPSNEQYSQGVKLITHEYLRDLPHVKTVNYMTGIWLRDRVKQQQAYDVLYLHDGQVLELTRSNIFIVNDQDKVITPKDRVLHGITRKKLIESAGSQKIEQRVLSSDDLLRAKEVFITGTTKKVLPITQIDDLPIGDSKVGSVTKQMMELFEKCEEEFVSQQPSLL